MHEEEVLLLVPEAGSLQESEVLRRHDKISHVRPVAAPQGHVAAILEEQFDILVGAIPVPPPLSGEVVKRLPPPQPLGAERVEKYLLVVAAQKDRLRKVFAQIEQVLDDPLRIRAAVDVVAEENQAVIRGRPHLEIQVDQFVETAVDIADGDQAVHGVPLGMMPASRRPAPAGSRPVGSPAKPGDGQSVDLIHGQFVKQVIQGCFGIDRVVDDQDNLGLIERRGAVGAGHFVADQVDGSAARFLAGLFQGVDLCVVALPADLAAQLPTFTAFTFGRIARADRLGIGDVVAADDDPPVRRDQDGGHRAPAAEGVIRCGHGVRDKEKAMPPLQGSEVKETAEFTLSFFELKAPWGRQEPSANPLGM